MVRILNLVLIVHTAEKKKFLTSTKNSAKYKVFVRSVAMEKTFNRSKNDSVVAENDNFEVRACPKSGDCSSF